MILRSLSRIALMSATIVLLFVVSLWLVNPGTGLLDTALACFIAFCMAVIGMGLLFRNDGNP